MSNFLPGHRCNEFVDKLCELENECFLVNRFSKKDWMYEMDENEFSIICLSFDDAGSIVAFLDFWITFDSATICTLGVKTEYRKRGIATSLIDDMETHLKEKYTEVENITLEVRESNLEARNLYTKLGFVEVTVKNNYYENGENAIYMVKGI